MCYLWHTNKWAISCSYLFCNFGQFSKKKVACNCLLSSNTNVIQFACPGCNWRAGSGGVDMEHVAHNIWECWSHLSKNSVVQFADYSVGGWLGKILLRAGWITGCFLCSTGNGKQPSHPRQLPHSQTHSRFGLRLLRSSLILTFDVYPHIWVMNSALKYLLIWTHILVKYTTTKN